MPARISRKAKWKSKEPAKPLPQLQRITVLNNEIQNLESQLARERDRLKEAEKRKRLFEGKEAKKTKKQFSAFRTQHFVPVNLIQRIMWYVFFIGRKKSKAFPSIQKKDEKGKDKGSLEARKPLTMKDFRRLNEKARQDVVERQETVRRLEGELGRKRSELSSLERTVQEQKLN